MLSTIARYSTIVAALLSASSLAGCAREPSTPAPPPPMPPLAFAPFLPASSSLPPYVLEPEGLAPGAVVELDGAGRVGVVVAGVRVVVSREGGSYALDVADPPIVAADRIPARLGGGFLFRGRTSLYTSYAFDGWLHPVIELPAPIGAIAFGPKGVLVRASTGERWAFDLPTGARRPVAPPALVDVGTLGDGRSVALLEGGAPLVSIDGGASWSDLRATSPSPATRVAAIGGELFAALAGGSVVRVDPAGVLTPFERLPRASRAPAPDPRWRGTEPPRRAAVRAGARVSASNAVVAAGGELVEVDLATGVIVRVSVGAVPPKLACDAVRAPDEVVLACAAEGQPSVVLAGLEATGGPRVERVLPAGARFHASDDGGLVYGASCSGGAGAGRACARTGAGTWEDVAAPGSRARWVPRASAKPLAITGEGAEASLVDTATGLARRLRGELLANEAGEVVARSTHAAGGDRAAGVVDRSWSSSPLGGARGWLDGGRAVEIAPDGAALVSAFAFDRAATSGPLALARMRDGRVFQSIDRGRSWAPVDAPPTSPGAADEVLACSEVGCDLGGWLRLGWEASPPSARPEPPRAPLPPSLARAPALELACSELAALAQPANAPLGAPETMGLGASRAPVPQRGEAGAMDRRIVSRAVVSPPHGLLGEAEPAPRAIEWLLRSADGAADASRVEIAWLEPFSTEGAIRRASVPIKDLVAAARGGAPGARPMGQDALVFASAVPVLAAEPAGATPTLLSSRSDEGLLVAVLRGDRGAPDIAFAPGIDGAVVSAAALAGGDVVALVVADDGGERVLRLRGGAVSVLFELPAPPSRAHYPASPDALAVGPGGDIFVLRAPSGAEPASWQDPALVLASAGGKPIALAAWSTLTAASDPACRSGAGYRAILRTRAPWARVARGASGEPASSMAARVRWTHDRVCLEAIEIPEPPGTWARGAFETQVVARFTGPTPVAARVGVGLGLEARQPLACTLPPAELAPRSLPVALPPAPTRRD
jgi:hypothetical protein